METCGTGAMVDGFPGAGLADAVTSTGAKVSWGSSVAVTAKGGLYQLCWCARGASCVDPVQDFQLSIGSLSIAGPYFNEATCISGESCTVEALRGQDLEETDLLMILDTCGGDVSMGSLLREVASLQAVTVIEADEASGESTRVTQASAYFAGNLIWPGGTYQLCWCRPVLASGAYCTSPIDFAAGAGRLHLLGPSPYQQHRTCISGRACPAQAVAGYGLSADDRVLLLETCGERSVVERFFAVDTWELGQTAVIQNGSANATSPSNASLPSSGSGTLAMLGWGSVPITTAGGRYRMCWCAKGTRCGEPSHFRIDFAELTVIGLETRHSYTCISGVSCQLDGLQGEDLGMNQHLAVLDTCGVSMDTQIMTGVFDGTSFSWGSTPILLSGGTYRLCWCASRQPEVANFNSSNASLDDCSSTSDFRLDAGSLLLTGPSPHGQHFTCVSGQKCHIDELQGFGLTEEGYVRAMETCGVLAAAAQRMPAQARILPSTSRSAEALWDAPSSAAGGLYRLCWYAGQHNFNATNATATEPSDLAFKVDFGVLHLLGPGPLQQDRTCVSGQTCKIAGILGPGAELGSFLVQDVCGEVGILPRFTNAGLMESGSDGDVYWGTAAVTAAGGLYRLCWAGFQPDALPYELVVNRSFNGSRNFTLAQLVGNWRNATDNMTRTSIPEWLVDVGRFTLRGPAPLSQDFTCIAGAACDIHPITGHYLGSHDVFAVLETCGQISSSAESTSAIRFLIPSSGGRLAPTLSAGMYRLCWCAELGAAAFNISSYSNFSRMSCMLQQDFQVDVGLVAVQPAAATEENVSSDAADVPFVPVVESNDTQAQSAFANCKRAANDPDNHDGDDLLSGK